MVLALATLRVANTAAATEFDGMVTVGEHQLHVLQAGSGPQTVIFEAGFASDLSVWRKVAPEIAKKMQIVLYSRAGTGKSLARPQALTIEQSNAELEQLLLSKDIKPPYILVGHSYGGFLIRYFASRHPEQIAGLVFVDPADEGLEVALKEINAARVIQDQHALVAQIPPKWQADLKLIQQILDKGKLPEMGKLPDVPAVLLTSVRVREGSDFFQETPAAVKLKRERHQAFFSQFSNGAHVVTANSGHTIQMQEPELVIAAIEQVQSAATKAAERRAKQMAKQALMESLTLIENQLNLKQANQAEDMMNAALKQSGIDETEINNLGFDVLTKGKKVALAELILKYNASNYTQSHNAADSYGEVLMSAQKPEEAKRQFQRALDLGKASTANARTLQLYQENLEKAEKKLQKP